MDIFPSEIQRLFFGIARRNTRLLMARTCRTWRTMARDFEIIPPGEIIATRDVGLFTKTRLVYSRSFWKHAGLAGWTEPYGEISSCRWYSPYVVPYCAGLLAAGYGMFPRQIFYENISKVLSKVARWLTNCPNLCSPERMPGVLYWFIKYRYHLGPSLPDLFMRAVVAGHRELARVLCPAHCIIKRRAVRWACQHDQVWVLELLHARGAKWGAYDLLMADGPCWAYINMKLRPVKANASHCRTKDSMPRL
jgi:hypothetical protein